LLPSYCDFPDLFRDSIGGSTILAETIPYCLQCPDEEGVLFDWNVFMYRPFDYLSGVFPLRPHVMFVHGLGPNTTMADPFSIFAAGYARNFLTLHGFSSSGLQFRQDVKGLSLPLCNTPPREVIKTTYRAIQDVRLAVHTMFQDPIAYGIDTMNFFLMGNSLGGTSIVNAMFANSEDEWLQIFPAQYHNLKDSLGTWAPKHKIAGIICVAGTIYDSDLMESSEQIPLMLAHGTCDTLAPYALGTPLSCPTTITVEGGYRMACKAEEENIPYTLHSMEGIEHGWPDEAVDSLNILVRNWLREEVICGTPTQQQFIHHYNDNCNDVTTDLSECYNITPTPNPAHQIINIQIDADAQFEVEAIVLYDLQGQRLLSRQVHGKNQNIELNVNHLQPGFYLIEMIDGLGNGLVKSVVLR